MLLPNLRKNTVMSLNESQAERDRAASFQSFGDGFRPSAAAARIAALA
jgi:hypothetical protein